MISCPMSDEAPKISVLDVDLVTRDSHLDPSLGDLGPFLIDDLGLDLNLPGRRTHADHLAAHREAIPRYTGLRKLISTS